MFAHRSCLHIGATYLAMVLTWVLSGNAELAHKLVTANTSNIYGPAFEAVRSYKGSIQQTDLSKSTGHHNDSDIAPAMNIVQ